MNVTQGPDYFAHEGEEEFDPTSPALLDDLADDGPDDDDDDR